MSGVTLITGGAGFVGTNLAHRLLSDGRRVRILDNLSRQGVELNLHWLQATHGDRLEVEIGDVTDHAVAQRAVKGVREIFHFAAQVAVTTSLDRPLEDAAVNLQGTLAMLEATRLHTPHAPLIFTSTNKVYGDLDYLGMELKGGRYAPVDRSIRARGVSEDRPLSFCTPYGCSKGAADQYVCDYAHSYGLATVVFRMSCIYGPHQFGTEDQGWVAHFLKRALVDEPITLYGDGRQVRDILFVDDLVEALLLASENAGPLAGQAFNIGGGPSNARSLREVIAGITELRGVAPEVIAGDWRQGDQRYYVSDVRRFQRATGWAPRTAPAQGMQRLYDWLLYADDPVARRGDRVGVGVAA